VKKEKGAGAFPPSQGKQNREGDYSFDRNKGYGCRKGARKQVEESGGELVNSPIKGKISGKKSQTLRMSLP